MQITSKGQVTIPKEFRDALGLLPYTEVDFTREGNKVVITRAKKGSLQTSRGDRMIHARKAAGKHWDKTLTTEDIMRLRRT